MGKGAQIWLAKYKFTDFPEPDPDDVDSIRNFMRAKYMLKKWLDISQLNNQPWKSPSNDNTAVTTNKGTFIINPPALSHKSNNFSDNSSNSSLSRHSSLADVRSLSPSERRQSSISDISDHSFHINLKSTLDYNVNNSSNDHVPFNIPTLPKPNSNPFNTNQISDNLGRTNTNSEPNNNLDDFFSSLSISSTWNNSHSQLNELNNTSASMEQRRVVQATQTSSHNGVIQALPPQLNPSALQPQQYQSPIQNQQYSAINFESSG
ncbi:6784_t:CDS:2, partial [Acaulospora colombiana]